MTLPPGSMPTVAILAGGLASRLRPLTETVPKSMIPVLGRPFLEHQLVLLREQGFTDIVCCIGFLGEQIRETFGDGSRFGVRLRYSVDGETLRGTGGALLAAMALLSEPFLVLYGDSYLAVPFGPILRAFDQQRYDGLMAVFRNGNQFDRSNVIFREGRIIEYNKKQFVPEMEHIDWGLGILKKTAFDPFRDRTAFDLAEVYENLVVRGRLMGYEVFERFYEIGSFAGIASLEAKLR